MQIIDSRANSGYHDVCKTETFFQLLTRLFVERHDLRRLGKDEVGSSNLPISSTETRCPARDSGFLNFYIMPSIREKDTQKDTPTKREGGRGRR